MITLCAVCVGYIKHGVRVWEDRSEGTSDVVYKMTSDMLRDIALDIAEIEAMDGSRIRFIALTMVNGTPYCENHVPPMPVNPVGYGIPNPRRGW